MPGRRGCNSELRGAALPTVVVDARRTFPRGPKPQARWQLRGLARRGERRARHIVGRVCVMSPRPIGFREKRSASRRNPRAPSAWPTWRTAAVAPCGACTRSACKRPGSRPSDWFELRGRDTFWTCVSSTKLTDAATAAGFFDHPHLLRECQALFGRAPGELTESLHRTLALDPILSTNRRLISTGLALSPRIRQAASRSSS